MILSIWLIFILIAGVGFWFYYKKNKSKLKSTKVPDLKRQEKYSLTDLDQMLNHVTQKENDNEGLNTKVDVEISEEKKEKEKVQVSKLQEKSTIDFKNGIIASVILKKKDEPLD